MYDEIKQMFASLGVDKDGNEGSLLEDLRSRRKPSIREEVTGILGELVSAAKTIATPTEQMRFRLSMGARQGGLDGLRSVCRHTIEMSQSPTRIKAMAEVLHSMSEEFGTLRDELLTRAGDFVEIEGSNSYVDIHEAVLDVVLDEGLLRAIAGKLVNLLQRLAQCQDPGKEDKGFLGKLLDLVRRRKESIESSTAL